MELDLEIPARDCSKHPELAEQVRRAVKESADLVRDHSQMPLGGRLVVRLVSRRGFARYCQRGERDVMANVRPDEQVSAATLRAIRAGKRMVNIPALMIARRVVSALTLRDGGDGSPMITLVPTNIQQRGVGERELVALMAHELTHVTQFRVVPDHQSQAMMRLLRAMTTKAPPTERPAHILLFEGHATWVQARVTEQLYGEPIGQESIKRTSRGRMNHAAAARLLPGATQRDLYDRAAVFSGHVIEEHGQDMMRRVLAEPDLWPTSAEVSDPPAWNLRVFPDSEVADAELPVQQPTQ